MLTDMGDREDRRDRGFLRRVLYILEQDMHGLVTAELLHLLADCLKLVRSSFKSFQAVNQLCPQFLLGYECQRRFFGSVKGRIAPDGVFCCVKRIVIYVKAKRGFLDQRMK